MTSEANMWQWLRKANVDPDIFIYRVENITYPGGSDVQGYLRDYGTFYIELKNGVYPARESTLLKFDVHESQVNWHHRMTNLGSLSHVFLVQIERDRFLVPGNWAGSLRAGIIREQLEHFRVASRLQPHEMIKTFFRR